MKANPWRFPGLGCLLASLLSLGWSGGAATRYVWQDSPSPASPYETWATAARTIQEAVDIAEAGDGILVTNGIYATGGRPYSVSPLMTNRVCVDRPVIVRSVNGPAVTVIEGRQVPGTTNGDGAIRCVFLGEGAMLSGFTLTHGATRAVTEAYGDYEASGGGVWCANTPVVTNCVLTGNSAFNKGGGSLRGRLIHCTISSNTAFVGGGVAAADNTLTYCTLRGNSARTGGGVDGGTLYDCTLTGNWAYEFGGGAHEATLERCTLADNSATFAGGAARGGTLRRCTLTGNSATNLGGGAYESRLFNCLLTGNSALAGGGAAGEWIQTPPPNPPLGWSCTLYDCTVSSNSADMYAGGVYQCALVNCIVYHNSSLHGEPNHESCTLDYCCTWPPPAQGLGNVFGDPKFVDSSRGDFRLRAGSPCIDAGTNAAFTGNVDLEGKPRRRDDPTTPDTGRGIPPIVDLGAFEFQFYADVGLRLFDGSRIIAIACEADGITNSPLRISKDGKVYGVALVPTNNLDASRITIQTTSGTKAFKKLP